GDAEEWGQAALRFWSAMHARFDPTDEATDLDLRRSFTDGVAGPGHGGLADWAQFITAGITVGQLPGAAASAPAVSVSTLVGLGARMIDLFIGEEEQILEVSDSLGDGILDVRASDPVDNTVPSGRSAAAEAVLLLAELGT